MALRSPGLPLGGVADKGTLSEAANRNKTYGTTKGLALYTGPETLISLSLNSLPSPTEGKQCGP